MISNHMPASTTYGAQLTTQMVIEMKAAEAPKQQGGRA